MLISYGLSASFGFRFGLMVLIEVIDVDETSQFDEKFAAGLEKANSASQPSTLIVLITSDAPDGIKWCEDCAEGELLANASPAAKPLFH